MGLFWALVQSGAGRGPVGVSAQLGCRGLRTHLCQSGLRGRLAQRGSHTARGERRGAGRGPSPVLTGFGIHRGTRARRWPLPSEHLCLPVRQGL